MRYTILALAALLMLTLSLGAFTIELSRLPESSFPDTEASEDDKLDMADFLTANNAKLAKNKGTQASGGPTEHLFVSTLPNWSKQCSVFRLLFGIGIAIGIGIELGSCWRALLCQRRGGNGVPPSNGCQTHSLENLGQRPGGPTVH